MTQPNGFHAHTTLYIVDDDVIWGEILVNYFNSLPTFDAVYFVSPHAALASIVAKPPDILILDIVMPGMNGDELAERIREAGVTCKIIIITGLITPEEAKQSNYLIGNRLVLGKPVPLDVLKSLVHQAQGIYFPARMVNYITQQHQSMEDS